MTSNIDVVIFRQYCIDNATLASAARLVSSARRPSLCCSESYIGSKCRSASSSVYACWRTAVFTAQRQATLPRPFVQFPALLRGVISDLLTRRLCWCRQLAVRHWGTARFRRLQQEPGIRCLVMSGTCLPCSPSAVNSRLYCLGCCTLST